MAEDQEIKLATMELSEEDLRLLEIGRALRGQAHGVKNLGTLFTSSKNREKAEACQAEAAR